METLLQCPNSLKRIDMESVHFIAVLQKLKSIWGLIAVVDSASAVYNKLVACFDGL